MSRPGGDALPTVAAGLARVLADGRPSWVHPGTWATLRDAAEALAEDTRAATARMPERAAARVLGVGLATMHRLREPGGWLS